MRVSIGQDSHRFMSEENQCSAEAACPAPGCILGGVRFEGVPAMEANSDGDVVLHAITNAISGITCRNILGKVADEMCRAGITDSREYLKTALADLAAMGSRPVHLSISIECARPKISPKIEEMRRSIGALMQLPENAVGITATTGEGLTDFGRGLGISVFCILTVE